MRSKTLIFGSPQIESDEIDEVVRCLESGWLGTGPRVSQFEQQFAAYKSVNHTVAVNSCTAALHLSLVAADLGPGDEVITTPMTFCATVNAIIHTGATPVLADIDASSMNIDPEKVAEKITPRTRAILPVHFAGRPCDMDELCALATEHNLVVIEDCAHAIESEYRGRKVGTIGAFGCFSFYVTKNLVTGEGGMVICEDKTAHERVQSLALHGLSEHAWQRYSDSGFKHYEVVECGYKYNMMDMQAAIGIHQLARIEKNWLRRRVVWAKYNQAFAQLPITRPEPLIGRGMRHGYHLYTLLIDEGRAGISRDDFIRALGKQNIGTGVHYLSVPEHRYYQETFSWHPDHYPVARDVGRQTVSLPLSANLSDGDVQDVINAVHRVFSSTGSDELDQKSV